MIKKELLFLSALILVGISDWLTTIIGGTYFRTAETNPLMGVLMGSNMVAFSVVKLFAVIASGFAFYKAVGLSINLNSITIKRCLDASYIGTFMFLTFVVINNLNVLL